MSTLAETLAPYTQHATRILLAAHYSDHVEITGKCACGWSTTTEVVNGHETVATNILNARLASHLRSVATR